MSLPQAAPRERRNTWKLVGAGVLLAAAGGALAWSVRNVSRAPVPRERSGADFVVGWECERGHRFEASGAAGSRACPTCGGEAQATFTCTCTNAGCGHVARMQLRYDERVLPVEMRWRPAGEWTRYVFPPACPKCGKEMRPG